MNSTYKMFAVNEKIILYILFLIVLQFFYIFPTSLYIEFNGFVSPCDRWQSAYFDYIPFFVVGVVLASFTPSHILKICHKLANTTPTTKKGI